MLSFEGHPLHPGEGVPLFISAGPLKEAEHFRPFMDIEDPRAVPVLTNGGWTLPEWPGNATSEHPVDYIYYPERQMMGNARGLPCSGLEGLRKLGEPIKKLSDRGIKTIIQVTNLPHESPVEVIPQLAEEAAAQDPAAIEANMSCPNGLDDNGKFHPPTCNNPDVSAEVTSRSRERLGPDVTFGVKDSPHATSLESGVDAPAVQNFVQAVNPYIDFLVGINTIGGQDFPELECAGGKGGMSGPVVASIAREWLLIAREALSDDTPILSCGGVDSNNATIEIPWRLENGAMLVGGAQEFFRSSRPELLAGRWALAYAEGIS